MVLYICIEVLLLSFHVPKSLDTRRVVAFMRFIWYMHLLGVVSPVVLDHMQGRDVTGIHVCTSKLPIELAFAHPTCSPLYLAYQDSKDIPSLRRQSQPDQEQLEEKKCT